MNQFYLDHGKTVVMEILKGQPLDATHFVYAYVAKSIDYIKYDGETMLVWYRGQWKTVTAQYVIDSFKDMVNPLADLRAVMECHAFIDACGSLAQAYVRLDYLDWMPNSNAEYQRLKHCIQVVEGKAQPLSPFKLAS